MFPNFDDNRESEQITDGDRGVVPAAAEDLVSAYRKSRGCLSDEEVAAVCEGRVRLRHRPRVYLHIRRCALCSREVRLTRSALQDLAQDVKAAHPVSHYTRAGRQRKDPLLPVAWTLMSAICMIACASLVWTVRARAAAHEQGYAEGRTADQARVELAIPAFAAKNVTAVNVGVVSTSPSTTKSNAGSPATPTWYPFRLQLQRGGILGPIVLPTGDYFVAAETQPGTGHGPILLFARARLSTGPSRVTLSVPTTPRDFEFAQNALKLPGVAQSLVAVDPNDEARRGMNYIDNIYLRVNGELLQREEFRKYASGVTETRSLRVQWSGYRGYVSRNAPGAEGRAVWVQEFLPNWNRQDVFPIDFRTIPPRSVVEFGADVYVNDLQKGLEVGLVQPWGAVNQRDTIAVRFQLGNVTISMPAAGQTQYESHPIQFEPKRWYRLRCIYRMSDRTVDVYVDNEPVWKNVRIADAENPSAAFQYLAISGMNFAGS